MDQGLQIQAKITTFESEEVSSTKWEIISMTKQEEDLVYRMYRLVGQRWDFIIGRIPGRNAVEVERFWIMRHHEHEGVSGKRKVHKKENYSLWSMTFNCCRN